MKGLIRSMRIRPLALCVGLGATPGLAFSAHASYNVVPSSERGRRGCQPTLRRQRLRARSLDIRRVASGGDDAVLW